MKRVDLISKVMNELESFYNQYYNNYHDYSMNNKEEFTQEWAERLIKLIKEN